MLGVKFFLPTARPILIYPKQIDCILERHQGSQIWKHWKDSTTFFKPVIPITIIDTDNDRAGWCLYIHQQINECTQGIMQTGVFLQETWQLTNLYCDHAQPVLVGEPKEIIFNRSPDIETLDWGHIISPCDYQQITQDLFSPLSVPPETESFSGNKLLDMLPV